MTDARLGADVEHAVEILRSGGTVGLPTETVYGLGADASDTQAVARIFRIKGRPADHPLIVHVANSEVARRWSAEWTDEAERLADAFWPGPLTIVVRRAHHVIDEVTGGRDTVALRCPSHPMMQAVLTAFDGGIAAPSANRFGKVSPTTARHVLDDLGSDVDYVLDGGACSVGLESTIVDCSVSPPQILRPGAITEQQIVGVLGAVEPARGPSRAPGMLESHYAPRCRVHPVESAQAAGDLHEHLDDMGVPRSTIRILDASADPSSFATSMYADLRACDAVGITDAIVVLPPESGIGSAIRDRIFKAAAGGDSPSAS